VIRCADAPVPEDEKVYLSDRAQVRDKLLAFVAGTTVA